LLERLRSKAYGDAPLNVNEDVWQAVLDMDKKKKVKRRTEDGKEVEEEVEDDGLEIDMEDDESEEEFDSDEEEMEEEYEGGEREYVEDSGTESDMGDMEDYSGDGVSRRMIRFCRLPKMAAEPSIVWGSQFDEFDSDEEDEQDGDEGSAPAKKGPQPPAPGTKRKVPPKSAGPKRSGYS
jgi:protein MAK16